MQGLRVLTEQPWKRDTVVVLSSERALWARASRLLPDPWRQHNKSKNLCCRNGTSSSDRRMDHAVTYRFEFQFQSMEDGPQLFFVVEWFTVGTDLNLRFLAGSLYLGFVGDQLTVLGQRFDLQNLAPGRFCRESGFHVCRQ